MNANEIVRIDEAVKALHRLSELLVTPDSRVCCEAADLIESLQAQLAEETSRRYQAECNYDHWKKQALESQRRAQYARNELCLKCGRYRESHNGACNGCRWKEEHNETD